MLDSGRRQRTEIFAAISRRRILPQNGLSVCYEINDYSNSGKTILLFGD